MKDRKRGNRRSTLFADHIVVRNDAGDVSDVVAVTYEICGRRQFRRTLRALQRFAPQVGPDFARDVHEKSRHEREHFEGLPKGQRRAMLAVRHGDNCGTGLSLIPTGDLTKRQTARMALNPRDPGETDIEVAYENDPEYTKRELTRRGIKLPKSVLGGKKKS